MRALIDGDLILYRAANAVQTRMYIGYDNNNNPIACSPRKKELPECEAVTFHTMIDEDGYRDACEIISQSILDIVKATGRGGYDIYLTGGGNFRKEVYPEYKANRITKPILYEALKDYMIKQGATVVEGQEADDAMGIAQGDDTIICSYDKDMLMIPGRHYRFDRDEFVTITEEEGMLNFYKQLLTGDRTDNIPGLQGVGPKTAEKILEYCSSEEELYTTVRDTYMSRDPDLSFNGANEVVLRNARLLYIRREEDEMWEPPV